LGRRTAGGSCTHHFRGRFVPSVAWYRDNLALVVAAMKGNLHPLGAEASPFRDYAGTLVLLRGWRFERTIGLAVAGVAHHPRKIGILLDVETSDARCVDVNLCAGDPGTKQRGKCD
jgi:hypothetical protein